MANQILSRLTQTISTYFRIGTIRIKDSSGVVQMRNEGDTAYADISAKTVKVQGTNTSNAVILDAPSSLGSSVTLTLPDAVGSVNQVLADTGGDGTLAFITVPVGYPHGYISGFEVSTYLSAGVSTVSITAGECIGEDGLLYSVATTGSSGGTAGSGEIVFNEGAVGSSPSGFYEALTTGHWYGVYLITNDTYIGGWVGVRDGDEGTLPTGYRVIRRIGMVRSWNSTTDLVPSVMMSSPDTGRREVRWMTDINVDTSHEFNPGTFGLSGTSFIAKDYSFAIPPSAKSALFYIRGTAASANGSINYTPSTTAPYNTMDIEVLLLVVGLFSTTNVELLVQSGGLYFRSRAAGSSETIACYCTGYICSAHLLDYV